jgi:hypothetical protein
MCDQGLHVAEQNRPEQQQQQQILCVRFSSPSPPPPPRFRLSCLSLPVAWWLFSLSSSFLCLRLFSPRPASQTPQQKHQPAVDSLVLLAGAACVPLSFCAFLRLCTVESCRSFFFFSSNPFAAASGTLAVDTVWNEDC